MDVIDKYRDIMLRRIVPLALASLSLLSIRTGSSGDAHIHDRAAVNNDTPVKIQRNRDTDDVRALAQNLLVYDQYAVYAGKKTSAIAQFVSSDTVRHDTRKDSVMHAFWERVHESNDHTSDDHVINIDTLVKRAQKFNVPYARIDAPIPRSLNDSYFRDFAHGHALLVDIAALSDLRDAMRTQHDSMKIPGKMRLYLSWKNYSNGLATASNTILMPVGNIYIGVDNLARPRDEIDFIAAHEIGHLYQFFHPDGKKQAPGTTVEERRRREHHADSVAIAWAQNKKESIMAGARFVSNLTGPRDTAALDQPGVVLAVLQNNHDYGLANPGRTHPTSVERYRYLCRSFGIPHDSINAHLCRARSHAVMQYRPE